MRARRAAPAARGFSFRHEGAEDLRGDRASVNIELHRHGQNGAIDRRRFVEVDDAAGIRRVKRAAEENRFEIARQLAVRHPVVLAEGPGEEIGNRPAGRIAPSRGPCLHAALRVPPRRAGRKVRRAFSVRFLQRVSSSTLQIRLFQPVYLQYAGQYFPSNPTRPHARVAPAASFASSFFAYRKKTAQATATIAISIM